ncbi:MAG: type II secretion system protein [Bacilli bacterium]
MKKNKGFTLIELTVTIAIIGLLTVLVMPNLIKLFDTSRKSQYDIAVHTIEEAANIYISDKEELFFEINSSSYLFSKIKSNNNCYIDKITIQNLYDEYLIKEPFINPLTDKIFDPNSEIFIKFNGVNLAFEFENEELDKIEENKCRFTGENIENNYVIYSGSLFRILGLDENKNIKIILNENLSIGSFNTSGNSSYIGSYIDSYLNNYYVPMLNNSTELLVDGVYCTDIVTDTKHKDLKCNSKAKTKAGLLSISEYNYITNEKSLNFLNNGMSFWLTSANSSSKVNYITENGDISNNNVNTLAIGIRPVLTLNKNVIVKSGEGTEKNPYILHEKNTVTSHQTLIGSRYAGEYVQIGSYNYRIIDNKNSIRAITVEPIKVSGEYSDAIKFGSTNKYDIDSTENIANYLNNTIYNKLFKTESDKKLIINDSFKQVNYTNDAGIYNSISSVDSSVEMKIGLPNIYDLYTGFIPTTDDSTHFSASIDASNIYKFNKGYSLLKSLSTSSSSFYPVISIKPTAMIIGGNGTKIDPYTIK